MANHLMCIKDKGELVYIQSIEKDIGGGDTQIVGEVWACPTCGETYEWDGSTLKVAEKTGD